MLYIFWQITKDYWSHDRMTQGLRILLTRDGTTDVHQLSVHFSRPIMSNSLQPHGLQHARLPCPSPTPRACPNSHLSSQWCHPTISTSVVPFSSCLQSFPASVSFPMSQIFFTSCGQSIGVSASASVLPMNIQDWFPLGLTGLIYWMDAEYYVGTWEAWKTSGGQEQRTYLGTKQ